MPRRSRRVSSRKYSSKSQSSYKTRDELWDGALTKAVGTVENGDDGIVEMTGIDSVEHIVYSRVVPTSIDSKEPIQVTINMVLDVIVDEGWRHVVKHIMEEGEHIEPDSYPPAKELLKLGSVWVLNETEYVGDSHKAHAKRLDVRDELLVPNWKDMSLRVHYVPDRFHAANEVDWSKYCRGLLLGAHNVQATIAEKTPHVPISGLPNQKDGAIVYEDTELGFVIVNKPGSMPGRATMSNHSEDLVSVFSKVLRERKRQERELEQNPHPHICKKIFVSLPLRVDNEISGLTILATKKEFVNYLSKLNDAKKPANNGENDNSSDNSSFDGAEKKIGEKTKQFSKKNVVNAITKKYRCLVCVREPNSMDVIEKFHINRTVITHYVDPKSPAPKRFLQRKPKQSHHDWQECAMRITNIGDDKFRAACVSSQMGSSVDFTLAHRLWGNQSRTPAEDLGVTYVMQVEVELLTTPKTHQLRGQLAALGFSIVGDELYGGGTCEFRSHRHGWNQMAVQCCELIFPLPEWSTITTKKPIIAKPATATAAPTTAAPTTAAPTPPTPPTPEKNHQTKNILVQSGDKKMCSFLLSDAWWTRHLQEYDDYVNCRTYYNTTKPPEDSKDKLPVSVKPENNTDVEATTNTNADNPTKEESK